MTVRIEQTYDVPGKQPCAIGLDFSCALDIPSEEVDKMLSAFLRMIGRHFTGNGATVLDTRGPYVTAVPA